MGGLGKRQALGSGPQSLRAHDAGELVSHLLRRFVHPSAGALRESALQAGPLSPHTHRLGARAR
jgi:hypothetical protein